MPVEVDLKSRPVDERATMSIGALAAESGLAPSAIRYYETRGLVDPVGRIGGRRRYDATAVRRLALVGLCRRAGFSLDECLVLFADQRPDRAASRALGERKLAEIDAQIADLAAARRLVEAGLACTCVSLEACSCGAGSDEFGAQDRVASSRARG